MAVAVREALWSSWAASSGGPPGTKISDIPQVPSAPRTESLHVGVLALFLRWSVVHRVQLGSWKELANAVMNEDQGCTGLNREVVYTRQHRKLAFLSSWGQNVWFSAMYSVTFKQAP